VEFVLSLELSANSCLDITLHKGSHADMFPYASHTLWDVQRHIMIVDELIHNDVSSTKVRYPQYPLGLLSPFMLSLDMEERYERLGNRGYN
jgi:hypothetical protein